MLRGAAYLLLVAGLLACSSRNVLEPSDAAPANPRDISNVQNAVPRVEPRSRYGNPASYVVYGKRYYTLKSAQATGKPGMPPGMAPNFMAGAPPVESRMTCTP